MKRFLNHQTIAILGAIAFVLGATIAFWETKTFRESEYAEFSARSVQLVSVFARSASV